jgi:hypothetical protein
MDTKYICVWASYISDFEFDWIKELLPENTIFINDEIKEKEYPNTPCIYITNYWCGYKEQLEKANHNFGIIYLGEEILCDKTDDFLNNPKCKFIWRNYVHPKYLDNPKVSFFPCAYKKGFTKNPLNNLNKKYVWSFAGAVHHNDRIIPIETMKCITPYKLHKTQANSFDDPEGLPLDEYKNTIEESMYVLCPPGKIVMECSRLYEALEAGSVPITISNGLESRLKYNPSYHHFVFPKELGELPFIIVNDWKDVISIISEINNNGTYFKMQKECKTYWIKCKEYWKNKLKDDINTKIVG